jgi:hypothetical protein
MTQNEIIPEVFPGELVAVPPSGAFESDFGEFEGEEEVRRGGAFGSRSGRGRPVGAFRGQRKRPLPGLPKPKPRRPRRPWPAGPALWGSGQPYPVAADAGTPVPQGSEHVRWTQDCLNRVMSAQLPVDGVMTAATRSVVRSFQQRENLRVTGIVGPDTQEALKRACAGEAPSADEPAAVGDAPVDQEWGFEAEDESLGDIFGRIAGGIGSAYGRVTDVLGGASGSRIIDLTANSDKSHRKGKRDPKKVYALVLHQMACCFKPKDPLKRFLTINSHFAITADGRILQLHPITELLWASNGFNAGSVAVEFAGNFPNIKGTWWQGDKFGRDRPTPAQLEAGRYLARYLINTMGLTHILAHRQSSGSRENDPGPEVWYHVGQWAVENLGLKDGGPGFKLPGANPIPNEWRNWGRGGVTREMQEPWETETGETEAGEELWQGRPEGPWSTEVPLTKVIDEARRDPNAKANGPGVYTIYKDGQKLYVGKSHNLRRRLEQHLWCLSRMDIKPAGYSVKVTPMKGANDDQLRRVESAVIKKWGRRHRDPGGILTNAAPELEEQIWGEAWT